MRVAKLQATANSAAVTNVKNTFARRRIKKSKPILKSLTNVLPEIQHRRKLRDGLERHFADIKAARAKENQAEIDLYEFEDDKDKEEEGVTEKIGTTIDGFEGMGTLGTLSALESIRMLSLPSMPSTYSSQRSKRGSSKEKKKTLSFKARGRFKSDDSDGSFGDVASMLAPLPR